MPTINSITLLNFKGAAKTTIDFNKQVDSPVITLVGLNESGKTTLLEALSFFVSGDNALSKVFGGIHTKATIEGIIPIHRKAAFTDTITIEASVSLDEKDFQKSQKVAELLSYEIEESSFPKEIKIAATYEFEDSVLKEHYDSWELEFSARPKAGRVRKLRSFSTGEQTSDGETDLWDNVSDAIKRALPRISYFPTFLVDLPQRIYLSEHTDEKPVNRYYRLVFQDILDSLNENLSLEKHVSKRIVDARASDGTANWFSQFMGGIGKDQVDAVFQKLSNAVTKEVLGSWERVFQRKISAKNIVIDWNVDTQKGNLPYASFYVSDGESKYAINERSLGFRWFFSFLLFTAFKQASSRPTIFLFDEPAANLHAKAQAELLTSFAKITGGGNKIIYSTHSHHMINPRWLSGAYIVDNTAIDYDSDDTFGLSTKPTNVVATRYRHFVAQYPARTSYFQPIIEKLEYVAPELLGFSPFLIVEGITDFYALKFVHRLHEPIAPFSIMPSVGAGASDLTISHLLGRGEKFILLLDDDAAGRTARERYREKWFLPETGVVTLGDLDPKFANRTLEALLTLGMKQIIQDRMGKPTLPTKKEIGWYLAEICAGDSQAELMDTETIQNLQQILSSIQSRFSASTVW